MRRFFKKTLFFLALGFAALGILACIGLGYSFATAGTAKSFIGAECRQCALSRLVPLPPQTEEGLPMAVDMYDYGDYQSFIVFRAPADWQEAFCRFYPSQPGSANDENIDFVAHSLAADAGDERISRFLNEKTWHPLFKGRQRVDGGLDLYALRDESGEYVMVLGINW